MSTRQEIRAVSSLVQVIDIWEEALPNATVRNLKSFLLLGRRNRQGEMPSIQELADEMAVVSSTMNRNLQTLSKAGLIGWQDDPKDERKKLLGLTTVGYETYESMLAVMDRL
jgi:DNA-binding MarR family transcriptional regulator